MHLVPLAPIHAAEAARLHIAGQPGTFLTRLGPAVLTLLYRTLPIAAGGFGFVVLTDDGEDAAVATLQLQGFVSATTSTGQLFVEMGTRQVGQLLPPLVQAITRQPALLLQSAQTLLYPLLERNHAVAGPSAELLSIMVEPAARSQGIGAALLSALRQECQRRKLATLTVTVDAANDGARRFYERHGFKFAYSFHLYGRAMCSYHLALPQRNGESA